MTEQHDRDKKQTGHVLSDSLRHDVAGGVYGFYVDFGEHREGLVVTMMISGDPQMANPAYPLVGEEVEALLIGDAEIGQEPRLTVRPRDLAAERRT